MALKQSAFYFNRAQRGVHIIRRHFHKTRQIEVTQFPPEEAHRSTLIWLSKSAGDQSASYLVNTGQLPKHTKVVNLKPPKFTFKVSKDSTSEVEMWYWPADLSDRNWTQQLHLCALDTVLSALDGLEEHHEFIKAVVDNEQAAGINPRQILFGGSLQGATQAVYSILRNPQLLLGVLGWRGYVPCQSQIMHYKEAPFGGLLDEDETLHFMMVDPPQPRHFNMLARYGYDDGSIFGGVEEEMFLDAAGMMVEQCLEHSQELLDKYGHRNNAPVASYDPPVTKGPQR